jgi:fructosamine-3-kinase
MGNSGLTSTGKVEIFDPASFIGDVEFGFNYAP